MRCDIAAGNDRDVDALYELGGERMIGATRVHLLGRARVQRERARAGLDESRADLECGSGSVTEPATHLDRDRDVDRLAHRCHDRRGAGRLFEQRGAGAGLGHLRYGTAEVHIQDVGSGRFDHAGRLGHGSRAGAEDLHRERALVLGYSEIAQRALIAMVETLAADHLGADETRSVLAALAPKGLDAYAGHRGEHQPRRDLDRSDAKGARELDWHELMLVV